MKRFKPFKIPVCVPPEKPKIIKRHFAQVELEKYLKKHEKEIRQVQREIKQGKYRDERLVS